MAHAHEVANFCGNNGNECNCGHEEKKQQTTGSCGAEGKECHCNDDTFSHSKSSLGGLKAYRLLILAAIATFIFAAIATWATGYYEIHVYMQYFMAGYFLIFGIMQTISLKKSAKMIQQYDTIAKHIKVYGYLYPLLQIAIGVAYLMWFSPIITNAVAATVLFFTLIGVIDVLERKEKVRCGCLGSSMNVSVGRVTLIENAIMFVMAFGMLVYFFATLSPSPATEGAPTTHQHSSI